MYVRGAAYAQRPALSSPKSGGYNPMYVGPQTQRDYAYHRGTAWPWLGGFYMEACLKIFKRTRLSFIERQMVGYEDEMVNHCLGTIPNFLMAILRSTVVEPSLSL